MNSLASEVSTRISNKIESFCSEYQLHSDYGFYHHLFEDQPLPSEFKALEDIVSKIPEMNSSKTIQKEVQALKISFKEETIQNLTHNEAIKLYSIVSFLTNSYLFNNGEVDGSPTLPEPLSTIMYSVTKVLNCRPIMTYACCGFWNAQVIDANLPVELDNLKLRTSFTGNPGEEWFFLISAANDIMGFKALKELITAQAYVDEDDEQAVAEHLNVIAALLEPMVKSLKRMHEKLDPEWFYGTLRKYVSGYQKFPQGLIFEGVPEYSKEGPRCVGQSGGQSPFYQTFQNALGFVQSEKKVEHMEHELTEGMLGVGKSMVADAKKYFTIRDYARTKGGAVTEAYNKIVDCYSRFKQAHWALIFRFIMLAAKKENVDPKRMHGVGGTPIMMLKQLGDLLAANKL